MNSARQQLNSALGAAGVAAVCAGLVTAPVHQQAPSIVVRDVPVALQAFTINDIVTRVTDAVTYGFAVAPVWYLGLPISIPMSIGIGFGLADLIPVVGNSFGLNWALDEVGRTLVGLGLAVAVYALGPPFMAVSSLLGITYPSVLPAAARPAAATGSAPRSAAVAAAPKQRPSAATTARPAGSAPSAGTARAAKDRSAAVSRTQASRSVAHPRS